MTNFCFVADIRAVIFDVDGTLIDDSLHRSKHIEVLAERMLPEDVAAMTPTPEEWGDITGRTDLLAYEFFMDKARKCGVERHMPDADTYIRLIEAHFHERLPTLDLRDGALNLLRAVQGRHLPIGVSTNAKREETIAKFERLGLADIFHAVSCLDDVQNPKPAPDVYERTFQYLSQLVCEVGETPLERHEVLVVEDTAVGATAGLANGHRVILWKPPGVEPKIDSAPLLTIVDSHEEVVRVLGPGRLPRCKEIAAPVLAAGG